MKIAEYKETPQEHIEVESAAPSLSKAKLTGGIVQLNLQANVDNWNLVEYPTGEDLHFYYLIYKYVEEDGKAKKGELVGAMVGETTEGTLDLTFPLTLQDQKYWVEIYYKDKASAGADFDNKRERTVVARIRIIQEHYIGH